MPWMIPIVKNRVGNVFWKHFQYVFRKILDILTAINKTNAPTHTKTRIGFCGCSRPEISPSNHFIQPKLNDCNYWQTIRSSTCLIANLWPEQRKLRITKETFIKKKGT